MSTPGPERVPSKVKVDKTSGQGKPPAGGSKPGAAKSTGATATKSAGTKSAGTKAGAKPGGAKPGANRPGANRPGAKGGKGRKPVTAVKVSGGRNWFPIIVSGVVGVVVLGIVGVAVAFVAKQNHENGIPWTKRITAISGVVDYTKKYPNLTQTANHKEGALTYPVSPPVGGDHNPVWENCMGDIYDAPVANENAVHSLEHGAVWVTYKPGLDQSQIDILKKDVQGQEYMLMSPYTGLDSNISVQVWGYQLKLSDASDSRIEQFIKAGRLNATREPGAACSSGTSATGTTPSEVTS
jgi:hypothetical protein